MRGQIVADFVVEHRIDIEHDLDIEHLLDVSFVSFTAWKLYFDGSVCSSGQGIGIVIVSPNNAYFEASSRLEHFL